MTIKLNMSKVFNRGEWDCLARVMQKLGFHDLWIFIFMMCITFVSYFVLINGEPKVEIIPSWGICQGDPLSPFLFLLCVEGLSVMLQREESLGNIKGISICLRAPHLSHLFFADDSVFFCRANMGEYQRIWDILQDYDATLGQKINKDKLPFSLARTPKLLIKLKLKTFLGPKSSSNMIDTWVLHPCWVEIKKKGF